MKMENKTYDTMKSVCTKYLPALIVLVSTILGLVHVDGGIIATVTGILGALNTFIGTVLGISTTEYWSEKGGGDAV